MKPVPNMIVDIDKVLLSLDWPTIGLLIIYRNDEVNRETIVWPQRVQPLQTSSVPLLHGADHVAGPAAQVFHRRDGAIERPSKSSGHYGRHQKPRLR